MKVAVIGCGAISDIYLQNMIRRFPELEVVCCCASTIKSAQRKAKQYGIAACTVEEVLQNSEIELVVNLTPPMVHGDIIRRALNAGKHVYTEKVLATDYQTAKELCALADEQNLYLGSAPDTHLGEAIQTARKAIDAGVIGTVTSCSISLNRDMEHFYEFLPFTRQAGGGMGYDIGPYYLATALSILGPVEEVSGMTHTSRPNRINRREGHPDSKKPYTVENENLFAAVMRFRSGVLGTIHLNGDCVFPEQPHFAIYGTEGILYLPNPDEFGGEVRVLEPAPCGSGIVRYKTLEGNGMFSENSRGLGVAEMVDAIRKGRPNRASKEMAMHTIELIDAVILSENERRTISLESTFQRPEPLEGYESWMG